MTTQRQTDSWFTRMTTQFNNWQQKNSKPLQGNIEPTAFLSVSAVVLTLSAFLYLGDYYSYFDINYFRVFTFEDGLTVLYEKGRLLLLFPMIMSFIAILFVLLHILRKKDVHKELKKNSTLLFSSIIAGVMTCQIFRAIGDLPFLSALVLGGFSAAIVVMYFLFDVRAIYFYPLLFGFGLMLCSANDVRKAVTEKVTYNLTMVDDKQPIPIVQHRRTFWIGSTSKVIFLYNDSTREVTEIPVEQVRKVNYIRPNISSEK